MDQSIKILIIVIIIIAFIIAGYFIYKYFFSPESQRKTSSSYIPSLNGKTGFGRYLNRRDYTHSYINKEPIEKETPNFIQNNNTSGRIVDYTNYNGGSNDNSITERIDSIKSKLKKMNDNNKHNVSDPNHHLNNEETNNKNKNKNKENQLNNQTDNQINNQLNNQTDNQINNQLNNQTDNQINNQLNNQTDNQINNQLNENDNINNSIYNNNSIQNNNGLYSQLNQEQYYNTLNYDDYHNQNSNYTESLMNNMGYNSNYEISNIPLEYSNGMIHLNPIDNYYEDNINVEPMNDSDVIYDKSLLKCNNKYRIVDEDELLNRTSQITGFNYRNNNYGRNKIMYPEELENEFMYNNSAMKFNTYNPLSKNPSGTIF